MSLSPFNFPSVDLPPAALALREEVREFLAEEVASGSFVPVCDSWMARSAEFSEKLGARGWLGVIWPKEYGGHERSQLERFVITAEVVAWGAPVAAHWVADRQTGPLMLRVGTEEQRQKYLPRIARGEFFFSIGMSEPDAGSDLASVRTMATKQADGNYLLNGTKVWTSGAHQSNAMVVFCRTAPKGDDRHAGFSQFIVETDQPGIQINPINLINGEHHFNEVVFDNVELDASQLLGKEGEGWAQVMGELAFERSGPERFLSTFPLLQEMVNELRGSDDPRASVVVGQLLARVWSLYNMSMRVFGRLAAGMNADIEAVLVKELGNRFEKEIAETCRLLLDICPSDEGGSRVEVLMAEAILHSPGFTLRGGTSEILRGIVARGLGLR